MPTSPPYVPRTIPGNYFIARTRDLLRKVEAHADADPVHVAAWAHTTRMSYDTRAGVLIDQSGVIIAHTTYIRGFGGGGARYITECADLPAIVGTVQDMGVGGLTRIGIRTVHVGYHDVCDGKVEGPW